MAGSRLPRHFTGQTYNGRSGNRDIDLVQLYSVLEDGASHVRFCAVTVENSGCASQPIFVEGIIRSGSHVEFSSIESDGYENGLLVDMEYLRESLLNVYNNLSTFSTRPARGNATNRRASGSVQRTAVSDIEGQCGTRYESEYSNGDGTSGIVRSPHIRIGYRRMLGENAYPCSPAVIHPENFSVEQLLDFGFSPDGVPSVEVVEEYSELTPQEIADITERRCLRHIDEIRAEYRPANGE